MTLSRSGKARLQALALSFVGPLASGLPVTGGGYVLAQSQKPAPVIDAPSIFEFELSTLSPMPITVTTEKDRPARVMLLIRGLPSTVALTEGRVFASGVWSVKIADLPQLKLMSPSHIVTSNITLSLVTLDGIVLTEKSAIVSVAASGTATRGGAEPAAEVAPEAVNTTKEIIAAIPTNAPAMSPTAPALGPLMPLTPEESEKLQVFMGKGEDNMRSGNINLARLFYKRSADAGWAPGALALAGTYDAEELARMKVVGGIQPDPALARKWYEKARDLGSPKAEQRLTRMGQR